MLSYQQHARRYVHQMLFCRSDPKVETNLLFDMDLLVSLLQYPSGVCVEVSSQVGAFFENGGPCCNFVILEHPRDLARMVLG